MKKLMLFGGILVLSLLSGRAQAARGKVLVVLSGVDYVSLKGGGHHPTGYFLTELATPLRALLEAGYEVTYTTPGGRAPAMDKVSDSVRWFRSEAEYAQAKALIAEVSARLADPRPLHSLTDEELRGYKGVFVPGGHAPMEDLYRDGDLGHILRLFHAAGKMTALICHAPVSLVAAREGSDWIYSGYRMTVFSTAEEKQEEAAGHLDGYLTYYVQEALSQAGGVVEVAAPWTSHVVRDRELITGQNPMSDHALADAILAALSE